MTGIRAFVLLPAALLIAACSRDRILICGNDTAYLEARSAAALRVPDDLSVPEETEALRIPESLPAGDRGEDGSDACLEESPGFSAPPPST